MVSPRSVRGRSALKEVEDDDVNSVSIADLSDGDQESDDNGSSAELKFDNSEKQCKEAVLESQDVESEEESETRDETAPLKGANHTKNEESSESGSDSGSDSSSLDEYDDLSESEMNDESESEA